MENSRGENLGVYKNLAVLVCGAALLMALAGYMIVIYYDNIWPLPKPLYEWFSWLGTVSAMVLSALGCGAKKAHLAKRLCTAGLAAFVITACGTGYMAYAYANGHYLLYGDLAADDVVSAEVWQDGEWYALDDEKLSEAVTWLRRFDCLKEPDESYMAAQYAVWQDEPVWHLRVGYADGTSQRIYLGDDTRDGYKHDYDCFWVSTDGAEPVLYQAWPIHVELYHGYSVWWNVYANDVLYDWLQYWAEEINV